MAKPPQFLFLDQGQESTEFSSGCFDLSANVFISDMVIELDDKLPLVASHLKDLLSRSMTQGLQKYGNNKGVHQFHFDPRDMYDISLSWL